MKFIFLSFLFSFTSFAKDYSFILKSKDSIRFKQGHHVLKESITFPKGKTVIFSADCNMRFGHKTKLIINGPMIVEGTKEKPIQLTSFDHSKGWPGIVVNSKGQSNLNHLDMSHMNEGLIFNGGKLKFSFLDFEDIRGPAGIILNKTEVDGSFILIAKTKKNAINCNDCTGRLLSHQFKNIGGRAIMAPKDTKLRF